MHRDPYRPEMAEAILARVPPDLDSLNEEVVTAACERLLLHVEPHAGHVWSVELGNEALVDSLPGVPGGTSFLGTFDREEAVADERLDYFAAGHPLVEGLLAHLEESPIGRVAVLRVAIGAEKGLGLLALYKSGPVFEAVAIDPRGRRRPDWAAALRERPLRTRRAPVELLREASWPADVRRLAAALDPARPPMALAALVVSP
jgi:ATP-dependent helicase HepA